MAAGNTAETRIDLLEARLAAQTRIIRKSADQTINNSTVLTNDTELLLPIAVNEVWFVEAFLQLNGASTTADWKLGWTGPAGAAASWGALASRGEAVTGGTWAVAAIANTPILAVDIATAVAIGGVSGTTAAALAGFFTASATPGSIQLQWAQNTATAENNKILTNSFLRCTRLG